MSRYKIRGVAICSLFYFYASGWHDLGWCCCGVGIRGTSNNAPPPPPPDLPLVVRVVAAGAVFSSTDLLHFCNFSIYLLLHIPLNSPYRENLEWLAGMSPSPIFLKETCKQTAEVNGTINSIILWTWKCLSLYWQDPARYFRYLKTSFFGLSQRKDKLPDLMASQRLDVCNLWHFTHVFGCWLDDGVG